MGIDPEKLFVLFVIALVVLGPDRLPQAARSLGRGLAHLRRYTSMVRAEVDDVLAEPRAIIHSAVQEVELRQASDGGGGPGPTGVQAPGPGSGYPVSDYPLEASAAPDDPALN